jgi:HK97 family phage portal protein
MIKKYFRKYINKTNRKSCGFLEFPVDLGGQELAGVESYYSNVIVHRCVNLIASSASHVPWQVFRHTKKGLESINSHPLTRLLKKPNAEVGGADFFTEVIAGLLLHGNSYLVVSNLLGAAPSALYLLNPSLTEVVLRSNIPIAYKYSSPGGEKLYPIDPITRQSQVIHLKNYHPEGGYYGVSSLKAAAKSIKLHSGTMDWNQALLKNSARPSGALVFSDDRGYLTDEQFERLQEQFYDNFSGSSNSGKPLILEGGLKWQETNVAERFEKFLELKDSSARDIAIAFNVPPQLLGISGDNTYSNMQEARLALWEENIIPLLDKISDALSNWLSHWYKEELIIDFDRNSISALTQKRENIWGKIACADFMSINEKRALVGLGPIEGGDKL